MEWKDLKPRIESADKQINNSKGKNTEFYKRQRMFWSGYKRGIGTAYNIFKSTSYNTNTVYEFVYSDCIWESGAVTQSLHRTKKGAEIALSFHKEEERKKWLQMFPSKKEQKRHPFGDMEHWGVRKIKIED